MSAHVSAPDIPVARMIHEPGIVGRGSCMNHEPLKDEDPALRDAPTGSRLARSASLYQRSIVLSAKRTGAAVGRWPHLGQSLQAIAKRLAAPRIEALCAVEHRATMPAQ